MEKPENFNIEKFTEKYSDRYIRRLSNSSYESGVIIKVPYDNSIWNTQPNYSIQQVAKKKSVLLEIRARNTKAVLFTGLVYTFRLNIRSHWAKILHDSRYLELKTNHYRRNLRNLKCKHYINLEVKTALNFHSNSLKFRQFDIKKSSERKNMPQNDRINY